MANHDLILGTAGHIDHGKTSLVRCLTGVDTDRLPAEKQRGITIDIGFAPLDLDGERLAIVDVPGHERFIRNMLAGATGLDLVMLVVAADDSVMPQTREHLEILRFLGIPTGLIALSKCDLADPSWLALVEEDLRGLIAGTFLEGAPIVRTSAATGQGIAELRTALKRLAASAPERDDPGLFRMAIDRGFTVAGHGTVATGTVASGTVAVGDDLDLLPDGRSVRVRGLQRHDQPAAAISRGARAAINLAGVRHDEIRRGQVLAATGYLEAARVLSVELKVGDDAPRPIRHRARYRIHLGTADVEATLALLPSKELLPGETALAQLFLAEPVAAVHGQPLVIREASPPTTLAGGRVLEPTARRIRRGDRHTIDRIERLRAPDPHTRVVAALGSKGILPRTDREICRDTGMPIRDVASTIAGLEASGLLVELPLGPRRAARVPADVVLGLEDRVLRALARLHASRPRQSTIPRSHVISELPGLEIETLLTAVLERLKSHGKIIGDARSVALKSHEPKLSQAERKLKAELAASIRSGSFQPPDLAALIASAGPRGGAVPELMALLCEEERFVQVAATLYLDAELVVEMKRRVAERLADGATLTMADLRDLLGTTRKFAVPIAEYLDRVGVTVRDGDDRRLGPKGCPSADLNVVQHG